MSEAPKRKTKKTLKKKLISETPIVSDEKIETLLSSLDTFSREKPKNITPELKEEIQNLVKIETYKNVANNISNINEIDKSIALDYVKGFTDREIQNKYNVTPEYLINLYASPSFITETKRSVYQHGFADKENLIRLNSRLGNELFEIFIDKLNDDEYFNNMQPDKLIRAIKETMELSQKLTQGDKVQVKIDITQLVAKSHIDNSRMKIDDRTGYIDIEAEYPEYDPNSEQAIGEWKFDD